MIARIIPPGDSFEARFSRAYARATLATVPQVRVVSSLPNVLSMSDMKTAPLGLGTYALKSSLPFKESSRAPSSSPIRVE
jgi:hypothetical protein